MSAATTPGGHSLPLLSFPSFTCVKGKERHEVEEFLLTAAFVSLSITVAAVKGIPVNLMVSSLAFAGRDVVCRRHTLGRINVMWTLIPSVLREKQPIATNISVAMAGTSPSRNTR